MLSALRDAVINLVSDFIFALLIYSFQKLRSQTAPTSGIAYEAGPVGDYHVSGKKRSSTDPLSEKQRFDVISFGWLFALSVTVIVPFLLGGVSLAIIDSASHGTSPLITDQMRREGQSGYVQYWLGFSILAAIEVITLLFRPWKGRVFGVSLGIALAVLLVVFTLPASRGQSLF